MITLKLIACVAIAFAAAGQTPGPALSPETVAAVAAVQLPSIVSGGAAYNQFAGVNLWGSAVLPVSQTLGLYESTTADVFPVKTTINGRPGYVFTISAREGVHKVIYQGGNNLLLAGADGGPTFTTNAIGISAAVTGSYLRKFTTTFGVLALTRLLYMQLPASGAAAPTKAWNPVVEIGFVWMPGAK